MSEKPTRYWRYDPDREILPERHITLWPAGNVVVNKAMVIGPAKSRALESAHRKVEVARVMRSRGGGFVFTSIVYHE